MTRSTGPSQRIGYRELAPAAHLAPYVARFYQLRSGDSEGAPIDLADPILRRLLPNGDANLLFDLGAGPAFTLPAVLAPRSAPRPGLARPPALAQGVVSEPVPVQFHPGLDLVGVAFVVGRSRPFLPVSAGDLAGRLVDLADLWGDPAHRLTDRLRGRPFEERVALLEVALERLLPDAPTDPELDAVIEQIAAEPGRVRVASLAADAGLSRQRFSRWFRDAVGLSPKRFGRVSRLQGLLDQIGRGPVESWSRLALRLGYYDQAHMIADFGWWMGESPARFAAGRDVPQRP